MPFIEITEGETRVLLNIHWIKSVFKLADGKTAIVVGDGYYNQANIEDQVERYTANEHYDVIVDKINNAGGK